MPQAAWPKWEHAPECGKQKLSDSVNEFEIKYLSHFILTNEFEIKYLSRFILTNEFEIKYLSRFISTNKFEIKLCFVTGTKFSSEQKAHIYYRNMHKCIYMHINANQDCC